MDKLYNILKDIRPDVDFANESDLVDSGILDSFDVIALVGELNDAYNIEIGVQHFLPENFNSVEAIDRLIKKLQKKVDKK